MRISYQGLLDRFLSKMSSAALPESTKTAATKSTDVRRKFILFVGKRFKQKMHCGILY
jgi:hypothetical protein